VHFNLIKIFLVIASIYSISFSASAVDNDPVVTDNIRRSSEEAVDDKKWATELQSSSLSMIWQHLKEQFNQQEEIDLNKIAMNPMSAGGDGQTPRTFSGIYIFVSSSMPKSLLKSYLEEANRYGAVLVLKGLPNGSFKELNALVMDLTNSTSQQAELNMQIDDEAFDRFSIIQVPSIILVKETDYIPNQTAQPIYDKIIGSVSLKYALEEFSKSGELANLALERLSDDK